MDHTPHWISSAFLAVACLAACSQRTENLPPTVERAAAAPPTVQPAPKLEPITLRGIPFDRGNVREALIEMCKQDAGLGTVRKGEPWCTLDPELGLAMPRFQFGNIRNLGWASLDEEGVLLRFEIPTRVGEVGELVAALEGKYGKPKITEAEVRNGAGTKFDQQTYVWVDDIGTMITVYSRYTRTDEGRLLIQSRSYQTAAQMREKVRREVYKSKL